MTWREKVCQARPISHPAQCRAVKYHEKHVFTGDYYSWEQLTQKSISHSRIYRSVSNDDTSHRVPLIYVMCSAKTDDIQVTVIPFFERRVCPAHHRSASMTLSRRLMNLSTHVTHSVSSHLWFVFCTRLLDTSEPLFQWFYQVLIENQGSTPVQLVSRLYHIHDGRGNSETVSGQGVNNMMPILTPHSRSFQFVSSLTLSTSTGLLGFVVHVNFML